MYALSSPILHVPKHELVLVGLAQKLLVSFTVFANPARPLVPSLTGR